MPDSAQPSRRRLLAVCAAILVPIVPIVVGLVLTSSGSGHPVAVTTTATSAYTPATTAHHAPVATRHSAAVAQRSPAVATRRSEKAIPHGKGALIAYLRHPQAMRASPGGRKIAEVQTKTDFGSSTIVLVDRVKGRWLGVTSTHAGNNRIGWIRAAGVVLSRDTWSLHAVLTRHTLLVSHAGHVVKRFAIATGAPDAPTPTGRFAVTDRLDTGDPGGPYGCCILALSAKAPHQISGWDGGNRIAIHSTPETDSIGYSVSHGCMRLTLPEGQWLIDHVPLGTPARISSA